MSESAGRQIRRSQDLVAWKLAHRIAVEVFRLTETFPRTEVHGLTSQMRRSANSIAANIAEGFGRHTPREYVRSLLCTRGSLAETESHLELAHSAGFLGEDDFGRLQGLCVEARKVTQGPIRHVRSTATGFGEHAVAERASAHPVGMSDVGSERELSALNSEP